MEVVEMTPHTAQPGQDALAAFYDVLHVLSEESREHAAQLRPDLERMVNERREVVARLREFLRLADDDLDRHEQLLGRVDAILHPERELQEDGLRGKRLGQVAVEVLAKSGRAQPIHYREWFQLVREAGHRIGGKDPGATFLTTLSRSPRVEAVGARTGLYRIRAEEER